METKTIDTIEINGKMIEIPRKKKSFERSSHYFEYLTEILKKEFPFNYVQEETVADVDAHLWQINVKTEKDYEKFVEFYAYDLWDAADEKETTDEKTTNNVKGFFNKFKKDKTEKQETEEKEKTSLVSKLLKPIKKIVLFPVAVVLLPFKLAKKGIKALVKGVKKINSKMPWAKNKDIELEEPIENYEEIDIELDEPVEDYEPITKKDEKTSEEAIKEAEDELKKGVNEELAKLTEQLRSEIERLKEENELLKRKLEIAKKQPERDKVWEEYFKEEKAKAEEKANIESIIQTAEDDIARPVGFNHGFNKDGQMAGAKPKFELTNISAENIKEKCKTPYTITRTKNSVRVYKSGIEEYRGSQKLCETEDTITITGELYESLLYSEYELNVHMRDMAVKAYNVPFYQVDYNRDGIIEKKTEKIGGKVVNASVVLTKERYKELVANADKYFKLMGEVSSYYSEEIDNQKKLIK